VEFEEEHETPESKLLSEDKYVCVTGKFSKTRIEIKETIEAAAWTIANGVRTITEVFVAGEDAGSNLDQAPAAA